jgi:hypothetical protein
MKSLGNLNVINMWRCGPPCVTLLLGRFIATQCEALSHNTLTVPRVSSLTRENFMFCVRRSDISKFL